MQLTINTKNKNELLNRTEVFGKVTFEKETISNKELAEAIAKELKSNVNLVVMKQIKTQFGQKEANFNALVYDNQEAKDKTEKLTKHIKKKIEETQKKIEQEKKAAEEETKKNQEQEKDAVKEEKTEEKPEEKPAEDKEGEQ